MASYEMNTPPHKLWRQKCEEELANHRCKLTHVHSLTGRSVPSEVSAKIKRLRTTSIVKLPPGEGKELPKDGHKDESQNASPLPKPGTIKAKLEFFENLCKKA